MNVFSFSWRLKCTSLMTLSAQALSVELWNKTMSMPQKLRRQRLIFKPESLLKQKYTDYMSWHVVSTEHYQDRFLIGIFFSLGLFFSWSCSFRSLSSLTWNKSLHSGLDVMCLVPTMDLILEIKWFDLKYITTVHGRFFFCEYPDSDFIYFNSNLESWSRKPL